MRRDEVQNRKGGRFTTRLLLVLLVIVFATGAMFAYWARTNADSEMRADLLSSARMLASTINANRLVSLSGTLDDLNSPDYQRLKKQLFLMQQSNSRCRFLYLLGMKETDVFFFADSEPQDSKDCSPPGQVYTEVPEAMRRAFTGMESVTGPYVDRWGTWVTAIIPMYHPETSRIQTVFCMDVDAQNWSADIHEKALPAILCSLLFVIVLGFLFILLRRSETAMKRIAASDTAIRESEERFRSMAEQLIDVIFQTDCDGNITYLSPAAFQMFGWTPEEMAGRHFREFVHEDDIPKAVQLFQNIIDSGQMTHNIALRMKRKDGSFFHGELNGTQITTKANTKGRLGLIRDVTYRKQTEDALRHSQTMLQSVFRSAPTGIGVVRNRVLMWTNDKLCRMTEYASSEMIGNSARMLYPTQEDFDYVGREKYRQINTQGTGTVETRWQRKDGQVIDILLSSTPLNIENLDEGVVFTSLDITERKRLEEQLRQAQKMEAVGQLAGGVAHDFNNLLQVILGYVDVLQSDLSREKANKDALEAVQQAAERAADLTRQLLAFSRRQVISPINMDLNDLVQGVLKMIRRVIGEHINLYFIPGVRLGSVFADKGQIEQALMNLCVNARDAMPTGGTLTIETENAVIEEDYCREHLWATEGRYVLLSITDTGHGMDEATKNQIFEPFFTTKEVGQGTGLGLATVHGIVKQHNGLIHVYSELGKGTAFKIYLPVVERPADAVGTKIESHAIGGTETILIAEDEESVRNLVRHILTAAGYTVFAASNGEAALQLFEENADKIDIALLDVMMPKLGGKEVMERIHERYPTVRFLFSSGYSENAIHTNFVTKEGLHLIKKPYHRAALLRAIRDILDAPA